MTFHAKTERNAEILRIWNEEGLSASQIAKRFGISKSAVTGVVSRAADAAAERPSPIIRGCAPKPPPVRRVRPGQSTLPPLASEAR